MPTTDTRAATNERSFNLCHKMQRHTLDTQRNSSRKPLQDTVNSLGPEKHGTRRSLTPKGRPRTPHGKGFSPNNGGRLAGLHSQRRRRQTALLLLPPGEGLPHLGKHPHLVTGRDHKRGAPRAEQGETSPKTRLYWRAAGL